MSARTILVVDDEPAVRRLAQVILEAEGYRVHTAEDAAAALDIAPLGFAK